MIMFILSYIVDDYFLFYFVDDYGNLGGKKHLKIWVRKTLIYFANILRKIKLHLLSCIRNVCQNAQRS